MTALRANVDRRIIRTATCWLWAGYRHPNGYGQVSIDKRKWLTHRYVYSTLVGPIPEGLTLDHLCRVRACCNPEHLEPCTLATNILRGEGPPARNARATHCKRGHEFTTDNIYWLQPGNRRCCRTCKLAAQQLVRDQRAAS